jgi:hypothetical protein
MNNIENIEDLRKYIKKIKNEKSLCVNTVFENNFTLIYKINNPDKYIIETKCGEILLNNVITKEIKKEISNNNIIFYKKNKKNVVEFLSSGIGEIIVGKIINKLFFNHINPHFIITLGYSTCNKIIKINMENLEFGINRYTNFSNISNYLKDKHERLSGDILDSVIISILHSSFVLEYNFSFIHFDLHYGNIFIKEFDTNNYFKGTNMKKIKYLTYLLPSGKKIYLKNYGFIIKIGDFDACALSLKNISIVCNQNADAEVGNLLYKIHNKYPKLEKNEKGYIPGYYPLIGDFIQHAIKKTELIDSLYNEIPNFFRNNQYFTELNRLEKEDIKKMTPIDELLSSKMFNKYNKKPKDLNKYNNIEIGYSLN